MLGAVQAAAQGYPVKPVRIIAPYPPGGGVDTVARVVAAALSESFRVQAVVDNRPGASGRIGTELAAKAAPDGYTLLLGSVGPNAIVPAATPGLAYDAVRDFAPINLVASSGYALVVHPSLPPKSVREFIAFARAHPGRLDFASTGALGGPHLAGELLNSVARIAMVPVNYKGGTPQMVALVGGEVPVAFASLPTAMSFVTSGRIRALGVTSARRSPTAPSIPAIAESLPGYEVTQWWGVLAPAGVPGEIVNILHAAIAKAIQQPGARQQLLNAGAEPAGSTPEEFARHIGAEVAKWRKVIGAAGLKAE